MKHGKDKNVEKTLRLPQINSKTSTSFSTQATNSRIRPSSSSKLGDLEKNLFAQLNEYDDLGKKQIKKSKTRKQIQVDGSKDIGTDWLQIEAPYLKKLQKMMPDTYTKILQTRRPEPLQQTNNKTKSKKAQQEVLKGEQKVKQKKNKQKEQKRDSFAVAQQEVEQIFQQYLQEQGLTEINQIKLQDLKQLNDQINTTEADINSLKQSMYDIIQKFGSQCINIQ